MPNSRPATVPRLPGPFTRVTGAALGLLLVAATASAATPPAGKGMNVLFIAVDDMRPELGAYGNRVVHSPRMDRLAAEGLLFNRAYCNVAICHPSRASLLMGLRPTTTGIYEFQPAIRQAMPDVVTLPQYFKAHGYHAQGIGKIFHDLRQSDPASWSVPHYCPPVPVYHTPEGKQIAELVAREKLAATQIDPASRRAFQRGMAGLPWEAPDVPDSQLEDGIIADRALAALREVHDRPFFLAVGFLKPHIPFIAPRKYWELYDPAKLPMPTRHTPPDGAPFYTLYGWQDTRRYWGMAREGRLTEEQTRSMIHGYYACISFVDAQVGRLLDELDRLGLRERTLVVLWGDHGYNLGDYGEWDKRSNYEVATRSPLIIRVPGTRPRQRTDALVEFVDLYPSLCELAGLPVPAHLEGTSFKPLLENPARPWKPAVFSHISRNVEGAGFTIGTSLRTPHHRLVEWANENGSLREHELYDHRVDPGETTNLAYHPGQSQVLQELTAQLRAGWTAARPPGR